MHLLQNYLILGILDLMMLMIMIGLIVNTIPQLIAIIIIMHLPRHLSSWKSINVLSTRIILASIVAINICSVH